MTTIEKLHLIDEMERHNKERYNEWKREKENMKNTLRYKVYRNSIKGREFLGAFEGKTLPELEKLLDVKDLTVDPKTVCNEYMVANSAFDWRMK